jgi:5'/3'-nucleotidase SurE
MIGKTLRPLYYRPSAQLHGEDAQGTTHKRPSPSGDIEEWILVDGTPASCVQIGLHHFFHDRGPIDLVVSGPNYGRNTTAVFALSSGTLGAALEAAVCQHKAIALSFAFFTRNHDPVIIEAACRHSVKVIDALYAQWPTDGSADLYSVNIPLVEGVEDHATLFTDMLQNYWHEGSCFQEIEGVTGDESDEEQNIREGAGGEAGAQQKSPETKKPGHTHKHFKWAPRFSDVYKSVEQSQPGNDGWVVKEGQTR